MTQGMEELFELLEPGDRADVDNLVKWEERTDRIELAISMKLSGIAQQNESSWAADWWRCRQSIPT